jgi:hypothetical protein
MAKLLTSVSSYTVQSLEIKALPSFKHSGNIYIPTKHNLLGIFNYMYCYSFPQLRRTGINALLISVLVGYKGTPSRLDRFNPGVVCGNF